MGGLMPIPWAKQSAHDKSGKATLEQLVNCYAEANPPDSETPSKVLSCPGLRPWFEFGAGPVRGMALLVGKLMVVSGQELYRVDPNGTGTLLGAIMGTGPVSMASDDSAGYGVGQCFIASNVGSYCATLTSLAVVDTVYYSSCTAQDGWLVAIVAGTNRFVFAGPDDFTVIQPLNFSSEDAYNGIALAVKSCNGLIAIFGGQFATQYYNSGDAAQPFAKVQGGVNQLGIGAGLSPAIIQSQSGQMAIDYMAAKMGPSQWGGASTGYSIQTLGGGRISTDGIESWIAQRVGPSSARSWSYRQGGHEFYVLNFSDGSICFDHTTGLWHDRSSHGLPRYRADCYASAYGLDLVGDYVTGWLYSLDPTYNLDNDQQINRQIVPPKLCGNGQRLTCTDLRLNFQAGMALDGNGAGSDPKWSLEYSDDEGNTWNFLPPRSAGKVGQYSQQARWSRTGTFYERTYRFTYSEPTPMIAFGAYAALENRYG
jgi:hypothetical protein